MSELAADFAGGGDLEALRAHLAQVRIVEQPEGIEEAEAAALELERAIGAPPRVASPALPRRRRRGHAPHSSTRSASVSSPFSPAIRAATGAVEAFVADVERCYLVPLAERYRGVMEGAADSDSRSGATPRICCAGS